MQRLYSITLAAILASSLAACDSRSPPPQPAAKAVAVPDSVLTADAELSGRVRNTLATTTEVEIGEVDVQAADGVVTISGTVEMPAERHRAAILALGIDGVRSVVNNLVVRGS